MVRFRDVDVTTYPELGWFAHNVYVVREALGLSQGQFGDLCGLSQPYISALEGLKANPTLEVMSAIAKATGLTVSELTNKTAPKLKR